MPREPLEAYLERMKGDADFRAALMAKDDIADRMELICAQAMQYAFEDVCESGSIEVSAKKREENNTCCGPASAFKGSSPWTAGYAKPSKAIEQRFKD